MPRAGYAVKSDLLDSKAAGGFGTSENKSWSMKEVDVKASGIVLSLKKNACCATSGGDCPMILVLANGTNESAWFNAADSMLALNREAKDQAGTWRPIEYRPNPDCGNSFHRVALNSLRAWVWDVPETKGAFKTKSRYVLHGLAKPIYSPEFDAQIDLSVFSVPDTVKGVLSPDGSFSFRS